MRRVIDAPPMAKVFDPYKSLISVRTTPQMLGRLKMAARARDFRCLADYVRALLNADLARCERGEPMEPAA